MVRNGNVLYNKDGTFNTLINMRPTVGLGKLEQTAPFKSSTTWTAGTVYKNGVGVTEASQPSSLALIFGGSEYAFAESARVSGTQMQVLRMTAYPAAETIYTGCLLVVNNFSSLGVNAGAALDIVIEAGGATFKWRKNGGAYTTGLACTTSGTSIDGGNATVYFLATSGFNPTDTWTWTRTDLMGEYSGFGYQGYQLTYNWSYTVFENKFYFTDFSGRVMVMENNGVRTAGYRPIYGSHVCIFYNHLYVASYSASVVSTRTYVIANSDRDDLENFIQTDTNEADSHTFSAATSQGNDSNSIKGFYGLFVINNRIYGITQSRIWVTDYLGLPLVNSWQELRVVNMAQYFTPIAVDSGVYYLEKGGVFYFDGINIEYISGAVSDLVERGISPGNLLWGTYDPFRAEVYFYSSANDLSVSAFFVYQELTESWFARAAGFTASPRSAYVYGTVLYLTKGLGIMTEDVNGTSSSLETDNNSGGYYVPTIVTQDIAPNKSETRNIVPMSQCYLEAYYGSPNGSIYSTTGITVEVSSRVYGGGSVSYDSSPPTWTTSSADGQLSLRPVARRIYRFRIKGVPASNKAVFGMQLHALTPVFDLPADPATR